jgi:hypothetical protein
MAWEPKEARAKNAAPFAYCRLYLRSEFIPEAMRAEGLILM